MTPIKTLPNFYNGKLYKKWISITPLTGQDGMLSTKKRAGKFVQLLLTDNGNKRELLFNDGKIMDTLDIKGIKRTYIYKKDGKDTVKGQMFVSENSEKQKPLITAAKWIANNCRPQKLFLKLNPEHKASEIFIPAKYVENKQEIDYLGIGKKVTVKEVLAKDFDNIYAPIPKTIILKTSKDTTEIITADSAEENMQIINQLGIKSDVLGWKLKTMV